MLKGILERKDNNILNLNRRNQVYIRPHNPISAKRLADNKIVTKRILGKVGIKTPELFKVIRNKAQLEHMDWNTLPKSFVIKPNRGSMGSGIIVFYGKKKNSLEWIRPNGQVMGIPEIKAHMEKMLEGRFSRGDRKDIVIIEERIKTDSELKKYAFKGVPDIRLIVFNQVPVMAMLRLPTKRSDGKANLHAGGICAGIDIASGLTTFAMHMKKKSLLDDTYESLEYTYDLKQNQQLRGIKVPFWDQILEIAVKCQHASGLGFLGVDIVIDRDKGPMVLELNARPGLGIQIANNDGLRERLERVEGLKIKSVKHGIRVGKDLFGGEIEESIEEMSGKKVVNLVEKVTVYYNGKNKKEIITSMLDTGLITSRVDRGLAGRLGFSDAIKTFTQFGVPEEFDSFTLAQEYIDHHEELLAEHPQIKRLAKIMEGSKVVVRPVLELDIKISGARKTIEAVVSSRNVMLYSLIIGRNDLKDYLIDASRTFTR